MLAPHVLGIAAGQRDDRRPPGPACAASRASRPSPLPEAKRSQQPRRPHGHGGPVRVDHHVPGLAGEAGRPALQLAARRSTPPPMPVPRVTSTRSVGPMPAPTRCSATRRAVGVVVDRRPAARWPSASATADVEADDAGQVGREAQDALAIDQPGDAHTRRRPGLRRPDAASSAREVGHDARPAPRRWRRRPRGVSTRASTRARRGSSGSSTRPRILVPPTSMPATRRGPGRGRPSVPQQGADAPHHVEIGVVDADLDVARLGQGRPRRPARRCRRPASARRRTSDTSRPTRPR